MHYKKLYFGSSHSYSRKGIRLTTGSPVKKWKQNKSILIFFVCNNSYADSMTIVLARSKYF
jgi:hypothetical protein